MIPHQSHFRFKTVPFPVWSLARRELHKILGAARGPMAFSERVAQPVKLSNPVVARRVGGNPYNRLAVQHPIRVSWFYQPHCWFAEWPNHAKAF